MKIPHLHVVVETVLVMFVYVSGGPPVKGEMIYRNLRDGALPPPPDPRLRHP